MNYTERAILFECHGDRLVGILAQPERSVCDAGVVVVVGGPQYRVGSHRQFVHLSRTLADAGIPCLRFDYRGMGDSEGTPREFTNVSDDIAAAVEGLLERCPSVRNVVLWGLCDGATASAFCAAGEPRISGLVLLNPWVHTEHGEARAYLKHYYIKRLASAAFWRKLRQGDFSVGRSLGDAWQLLRSAVNTRTTGEEALAMENLPLPDRLRESLAERPTRILILLSGRDFVAREFEDLIKGDESWTPVLSRATVRRMPKADHTFSDPKDAALAAETTRDWLLDR
ncbi:hydrolase 1, exosortase A system-associated [Lentisalinibacter salinarum]|uniref:hydrolase 1, exosortase A system-associated n=1 Tax=Lentisalinibacter salinarum TaxID=2992239 RepID=UPI0038673CDA